ncbi:hypothetical protein CLOLEP_02447 [[Clostridium] leptum DSM 753]|uniref:Uncharacterized protein n=1 Tax=[Clostridium] leptum DSM 753 TaxID=428125 RepID=A7VV42_9FIRM|nr:hypothetical protein CLOLEP_02447 [[Clostridium] leptum DSM 753]
MKALHKKQHKKHFWARIAFARADRASLYGNAFDRRRGEAFDFA